MSDIQLTGVSCSVASSVVTIATSAFSPYVPQIGEDVRTAREEAGRTLAERIVERLETAW